MIISVTSSHIDLGLRKHCKKCPVATALFQQLKTAFTTTVRGTYPNYEMSAYFVDELGIAGRVVYYHIPRSVKRFVRAFDKGGRDKVKPFKFKLKELKSEQKQNL